MDSSSGLNATEIAVGSLLAGGRGGYGGGYGGGGAWGGGYGGGSLYTGNNVLAAEAHANGTSTKEAIDGNANLIRAQNGSFENAERARQFAELSATANNNVDRVCERINNIELNALRATADTVALINDNAKDAAKCCCDSALENCKQHSELMAEIKAVESRTIARELDAANAKITQLETINALSERSHR